MDEKPDLKLYYSIGEVARMLNLNESTLRYWEKEFPKLRPKKASRSIRQYSKENVELIKLIYHLVKEQGLTIQGARERLKVNRENVSRDAEIMENLMDIRSQLAGMRDALDAFTFSQIEDLADKLEDEEQQRGH